MLNVIAGILILTGGLLSIVAAVGLMRLPDVLTRMHASTKVATLASILKLSGCAIAFGEVSVIARCVMALLFLFLTAPVAAHMIGRASLRPHTDGTNHEAQDTHGT